MSTDATWDRVDPADVIERSHLAFVEMDSDGLVREWNAAAERIFGWPRDEAVGSRLSELIIPPRYRELHERGLRTFLETGIGPVLDTTIEIDGVDRAGRKVPVELTITPTRRPDGTVSFHAFLNDITHRRRMDRFLAASARVAWLCAESPGSVPAGALLEAIGTEMSFELGIAWLPLTRPDRIDLAASWAPSDTAATFVAESSVASFERGVGLPGSAFDTGEPWWSADVSTDPRFVRRAAAESLGLRSGLFLPIGRRAACVGVLEFLSFEPRSYSDDQLEQLADLGERIAPYVVAPSR